MYRALGCAHATGYHHLHRLTDDDDGQGTVEYIGLILLLAGVMAAVVKFGHGGGSISTKITGELSDAIDSVVNAKK